MARVALVVKGPKSWNNEAVVVSTILLDGIVMTPLSCDSLWA